MGCDPCNFRIHLWRPKPFTKISLRRRSRSAARAPFCEYRASCSWRRSAEATTLLRDIAIDYLETHFGHKGLPVSDLVAEIVVDHLGFDTPDLSKVARLLKLHPRTLQRILSAEGTSFNNIVDEVRRDQTLKLITTTQLSFSQIATRVGMREQSSLARAVRRWFNTSPSRLRGETANASDSGIDKRSFQ